MENDDGYLELEHLPNYPRHAFLSFDLDDDSTQSEEKEENSNMAADEELNAAMLVQGNALESGQRAPSRLLQMGKTMEIV